jgi:hypothetical protein
MRFISLMPPRLTAAAMRAKHDHLGLRVVELATRNKGTCRNSPIGGEKSGASGRTLPPMRTVSLRVGPCSETVVSYLRKSSVAVSVALIPCFDANSSRGSSNRSPMSAPPMPSRLVRSFHGGFFDAARELEYSALIRRPDALLVSRLERQPLGGAARRGELAADSTTGRHPRNEAGRPVPPSLHCKSSSPESAVCRPRSKERSALPLAGNSRPVALRKAESSARRGDLWPLALYPGHPSAKRHPPSSSRSLRRGSRDE